ncbi:hypothetical protein IAU59_003213 [Kwoniella sp. CBS 9459]
MVNQALNNGGRGDQAVSFAQVSEQNKQVIFEIFGPILLGTVLSVFGFGLFCMQTALYFDSRPKASRTIKGIVVLALNFAQTICDCSRIFNTMILHALDLAFFLNARSRLDFTLSPILSVLIAAIVQMFLARRVVNFMGVTANPAKRSTWSYKVQTWGLAIMLGVGILLGLAGGWGVPLRAWVVGDLTRLHRGEEGDKLFTFLGKLWLGSVAATDILISGFMVYSLRTAAKASENRHRVVSSLIQLTLSSGVIVTALQITALILFMGSTTAWSDLPVMFMSKVYSLTLVSAISQPQRAAMRDHRDDRYQQPVIPPPQLYGNNHNHNHNHGHNRPHAHQPPFSVQSAASQDQYMLEARQLGSKEEYLGLEPKPEREDEYGAAMDIRLDYQETPYSLPGSSLRVHRTLEVVSWEERVPASDGARPRLNRSAPAGGDVEEGLTPTTDSQTESTLVMSGDTGSELNRHKNALDSPL